MSSRYNRELDMMVGDYVHPTLPRLSDRFRSFLITAKLLGYGSDDAKPEETGSGGHQITYESRGLKYVDDYVGGVPYGGHEQVAVQGLDGKWTPVWDMSYRGDIVDEELTPEQLREMMGHFLSNPYPALPIRGYLSDYTPDERYRYRLMHPASATSLESFAVTENIFDRERGNRLVYTAQFLGGLVNLNQGIEDMRVFKNNG